VAWIDPAEAVKLVKRQAILRRLQDMLAFSGDVIYRAYFVDPNRIDLNYQELEDRKI